jgi:hypothetical protein
MVVASNLAVEAREGEREGGREGGRKGSGEFKCRNRGANR